MMVLSNYGGVSQCTHLKLKVQEYEHIKKVYYGHKGISEHTLEGDEIFNHQYSTGYDLHLYSENNAFTIARSEISVIEVVKEN